MSVEKSMQQQGQLGRWRNNMGMKTCTLCGKSLLNRARKVTSKLTMRCRDCAEPDITGDTTIVFSSKNPVKAVVAKPNNVIPTPPKKREIKEIDQAINGKKADPKKHRGKKKKRKKSFAPVVEGIKKKEK